MFLPFPYFLCAGIPILKKVLSHAHKPVTSGHSLEIKFSLVMSCPGGPGMVNG